MPSKPRTIISRDYKYGFSDAENPVFKSKKGLDKDLVLEISRQKGEPKWMREFRLKSLEFFLKRPMPAWGADLSGINFDGIYYYLKPSKAQGKKWDDVPKSIRNTFERLGIPQAERKFLAGVGAQYDSELVYHNLKDRLKKQGVIFSDVETALKEHPELVKKYFATVIPQNDNKFAALNSAVYSGGSFVYVPKGVRVDLPLQAYFRINAKKFGQFERTLIIADEDSFVHYIEGCTAPIYASGSLHSAVVEIIARRGARVRYTTVQNWPHNVYNLVTKRAVVHEDAVIEWVDCNIGSGITMKYPAVFLKGRGARADILSMSFAGRGQHQDSGAKVVHAAPYTSSNVISKSVSQGGGRASYRGLLKVVRGAKNVRANVSCGALILDDKSRSDTYPDIQIYEKDVSVGHEASVSKVSKEQLFYLRSRGLSESMAKLLIVNGFIEPIVKELPMEYAVEMNRLIALEMEGSVG